MAGKSSIEWTEHTWNPIVGCSIKSPGCINCYAVRQAHRLASNRATPHYSGTTAYTHGMQMKAVGPQFTGKVVAAPDHVVREPLRRKKATTYFVNSMGDLFHENVPDDWIDHIFAVMALSPVHTFQVLTKRAERMRQWFANIDRADRVGLAMLTLVDRIPHGHRRVPWPLPNVWLGVSTERQQEADERIPLLLQTPAAIRFISAEPLLGPIDLASIPAQKQKPSAFYDLVHPQGGGAFSPQGLRVSDHRLDWVICGGESGNDARPMHPEWARRLRDQCEAGGLPFFFKQWGAWSPAPAEAETYESFRRRGGRNQWFWPDGSVSDFLGKKAAGRLLDGKEHNGFPSRANAEAA